MFAKCSGRENLELFLGSFADLCWTHICILLVLHKIERRELVTMHIKTMNCSSALMLSLLVILQSTRFAVANETHCCCSSCSCYWGEDTRVGSCC